MLGGMIFDAKKNKGINKKFHSEQNPIKASFKKNASIEVFIKAI